MTQPKVISRTSTQEEIASDYKWGFVTDIEADLAPKGLNEDIVRLTPEELKRKMAEKEAAQAAAGDGRG